MDAQPTAHTPISWWATVPPLDFTAYVTREQLPRMQGSKEARQINTTTMIVGLIDRKKG